MTEQTVNEQTAFLWKRGLVVKVSASCPEFTRQLTEEDMLLEPGTLKSKTIRAGFKRLISEAALQPINHQVNRARNLVARSGTQFPLGGYYVTNTSLPAVLDELTEIRRLHEEARQQFLDNYDAYKEQQLRALADQNMALATEQIEKIRGALVQANLPPAEAQKILEEHWVRLMQWAQDQESKNRKLLPAKDRLGQIELRVYPVRVQAADSFEQLDDERAHAMAAEQQAMLREIRDWARNAMRDVHRVLGEKASHVSQLLVRDGKLTPRSLAPLFEAFDSFKNLDMTGASEFRAQVDAIRQRFGVTDSTGAIDLQRTASAISDTDTARENFRGMLSVIGQLAEENVADQAGVRALGSDTDFGRFVDV